MLTGRYRYSPDGTLQRETVSEQGDFDRYWTRSRWRTFEDAAKHGDPHLNKVLVEFKDTEDDDVL